jgi:hypothetical protein
VVSDRGCRCTEPARDNEHADEPGNDSAAGSDVEHVRPLRSTQAIRLYRTITCIRANRFGDLTDDGLNRRCGARERACLQTLFDEEWAHNWCASRDLDIPTWATPPTHR